MFFHGSSPSYPLTISSQPPSGASNKERMQDSPILKATSGEACWVFAFGNVAGQPQDEEKKFCGVVAEVENATRTGPGLLASCQLGPKR